jgi:hypothetical protein
VRRFALVAVFAVACGTPSTSPAQSLKLVYHKGDVYTYSYHSTANEIINAVPVTYEITGRHTYTVTSVDSVGTVELSLAVTDLVIKATVNHITNPISSSPNPPIEITATADGRILSLSGRTQAPEADWAVLPDRSVKPGDTWSKDYDTTTDGAGSVHLQTRSTYLRVESLQGKSSSVVRTTADLTLDQMGVPLGPNVVGGSKSVSFKGTGTSDVTSWIDVNTHRLLKTHVTTTTDSTMSFEPAGTTTNGASGPIRITAVVTVDLGPA